MKFDFSHFPFRKKNKQLKIPTFLGQLTRPDEPKGMMVESMPEMFSNERLVTFFQTFECRQVRRRFLMFHRSIVRDRDRVRLHGQYYNNIYLGKRIFGPARKQMFVHSILGGMERRFEIVENQINHIPFTHDASDKHPEKCRNSRIKCRDDTRVVLSYQSSDAQNFIHANRVSTPLLFNDFIITQAPMPNTTADFWRLVWQEGVRYIFMLINPSDQNSRCPQYWPDSAGINCQGLNIFNEGVDTTRDPFFTVTTLIITEERSNERLIVEHWQANLNNSLDLQAPLRLLRLSRNCKAPTIVHDHLGISRAATLVAIEMTICNLLRGPTYKFPVQQAVHYLRSFRAFAIETPMQYIYIHRVVLHFIRPLVDDPEGFQDDYNRWMEERSRRAFVGDPHLDVPGHCLLSPGIDPDLLPNIRRKDRPEYRREIHAHVGELPLPLESSVTATAPAVAIPKMYPKGRRY